MELSLYGAPWLRQDPLADLSSKTVEEIAAGHEAVPSGVLARHGTGVWSPVQVPDLIGVRDRKYLDRTGLVRHRDIGDLMRYAAANQDADVFALYADFRPVAAFDRGFLTKLPPPRPADLAPGGRYSDAQLYALAKYVYSLKPPPNPNLPKTAEDRTLVARGEAVFDRLRCARCHGGDQYTSNKLTPADEFAVPDSLREEYDILEESVGTDPTLALRTRQGTDYYKVPSLRGVWYRGPFEHKGRSPSRRTGSTPGGSGRGTSRPAGRGRPGRRHAPCRGTGSASTSRLTTGRRSSRS